MIKKFCDSYQELKELALSIKDYLCPHCKGRDTLNRHGYIWGIDMDSSDPKARIIRAYRFLCNNRDLKTGCGRTLSVHLKKWIPNYSISAIVIWSMLMAVFSGTKPHQYHNLSSDKFSLSSVYRIIHKVPTQINYWRIFLLQFTTYPETIEQSSLCHTLEHFKKAFGQSDSLSKFQSHFQAPIWSI